MQLNKLDRARPLAVSLPSLGIHGTIAPAGVIRYQPVLIAIIEGRVYLEAHPDVYRQAPDSAKRVLEYSRGYGFADRVDWPAAVRVISEQRGLAIDVTKED